MAAYGGPTGVESRIFSLGDFKLENGAMLPDAKLAYETYGTLAPDGRNGVLLTHGYTSTHHAAGRYAPDKACPGLHEDDPGWWDALIGPGRPIDTDRLFCVSSNMLGSSYGSSCGSSPNPETGKPYGPDFPEITVVDMVRAQKALLDSLGVKHLVAVAGPSFGGYQAFQWAVTYPDFMAGIVATVTSPRGRGDETAVAELVDQLAADPNWNGGHYYETDGILPTVIPLRMATLKQYGIEEQLADRFPDPEARGTAVRDLAEKWARHHDAHSLVILRRAAVRFDAEKDFDKVRCKVLYVIATTDKLFPPSIAPDVMKKLKAANVDAEYFELETPYGHLATTRDADKWAPVLRRFMEKLLAT